MQVDRRTGALSDTRTRFLGTRPAILVPVSVAGRRSMLALSSRPWLGYRYLLLNIVTPHCSLHRSSGCSTGSMGHAANLHGLNLWSHAFPAGLICLLPWL